MPITKCKFMWTSKVMCIYVLTSCLENLLKIKYHLFQFPSVDSNQRISCWVSGWPPGLRQRTPRLLTCLLIICHDHHHRQLHEKKTSEPQKQVENFAVCITGCLRHGSQEKCVSAVGRQHLVSNRIDVLVCPIRAKRFYDNSRLSTFLSVQG